MCAEISQEQAKEERHPLVFHLDYLAGLTDVKQNVSANSAPDRVKELFKSLSGLSESEREHLVAVFTALINLMA